MKKYYFLLLFLFNSSTNLHAETFFDIPLDKSLFEFDVNAALIFDATYIDGIYRQDNSAQSADPRRTTIEFNIAYTKRFLFELDLGYDYKKEEVRVRDAYATFDLPARFTIKTGKMKQVFGLSRTSTLKNLLSIERELSNDLLKLKRAPGIVVEKSLLNNFFSASYFNHENNDGDNIKSVLGRYIFEFDRNHYTHLGLSFASEDYDGATYRVSSNAGVHAIEPFLKTQKITSDKVNYWGIDGIWQSGKLSILGEFIDTQVFSSAEGDRDYSSGYIQASWFITEDKHRFKKGRVRRMKVNKHYAFEFVSTLSMLDAYSAQDGFQAKTIGMGINYYYGSNTKIMAEYNYLEEKQENNLWQNGSSFILRFQYSL